MLILDLFPKPKNEYNLFSHFIHDINSVRFSQTFIKKDVFMNRKNYKGYLVYFKIIESKSFGLNGLVMQSFIPNSKALP